MIHIPNSFKPPSLPEELRIGDECIEFYAASHPTNIRVHNGIAYFDAHAEILIRFSSVCADLLSGDSDCKEILMLDIPNTGLVFLEKLLYTKSDAFKPLYKKTDELIAEVVFLLITKYGFPEEDMQGKFFNAIDISSIEKMQQWLSRCNEVPLVKCAEAVWDRHLIMIRDCDDNLFGNVWDYDVECLEYACDNVINSNYGVGEPFECLLFARAWMETKEGEYLMYVIEYINEMKRKIQGGILENTINLWSDDELDLPKEDEENFKIYEGELISALTWAEKYVEDGTGKCELQKSRVEEMETRMKQIRYWASWECMDATKLIFNLQGGQAT